MDETKKGFMQNIGNLSFKKIDEANFEFGIKVLENFLNTGGIAPVSYTHLTLPTICSV